MTWEERLRQAAYTAPSGTRLTFDFEDVSKSIEKKTSGFDFPDADGTYVQDSGVTGRRFPLRAIFWGSDCDLQAQAFENALLERGDGQLEHPIYGLFNVVPFGKITQRDDLKTSANQSIIDVTFWTTIGVIFPTAQVDPASQVLSSVDICNTVGAEQFSGATSLSSAIERVGFANTFSALTNITQSSLQSIADYQDDVRTQFNAIYQSINRSIDILIKDPISLALQTSQLIQTPARALDNIQTRLDAYKNLVVDLIARDNIESNSTNTTAGSSISTQIINNFYLKNVFINNYVLGSIISVINNDFENKADALTAAEEIINQFDQAVAWQEDSYIALSNNEGNSPIDTGETYQQLQKVVALTAGYLVQISFSLKQERRIVLDRARTIIDLCAELYGVVDEKLDFLINSNDLTGDEIIELPRGKEIVYYI